MILPPQTEDSIISSDPEVPSFFILKCDTFSLILADVVLNRCFPTITSVSDSFCSFSSQRRKNLLIRGSLCSALFEWCGCVCAGLAVASALVDVSQQMCVNYKEKPGGLRNRKQQPAAQPSTCIWASQHPNTQSSVTPLTLAPSFKDFCQPSAGRERCMLGCRTGNSCGGLNPQQTLSLLPLRLWGRSNGCGKRRESEEEEGGENRRCSFLPSTLNMFYICRRRLVGAEAAAARC